MATSNANITSPAPGTTQVAVQNDATPGHLHGIVQNVDRIGDRHILQNTPRGAAGGAYEAGLTGNQATQPIQPLQANAPVNFAAQAAKVQANPAFQAAYADQTVAGRTNADRVLSGMNPQQIAQAKTQDAAWNARQAAFDAANPVGTKMDEPTSPINPQIEQAAPQPAQNAAISPSVAPAQPTEAKAPQTPKDVAASIFAKNPQANQRDFQAYINSSGIAGTSQENQVWDAYHEFQHLQNGMQKYGTSDVNSLSAAISNGDLAVGSPTWNAVAASNPNAALAKQKYEADLRTKTNNELAAGLVNKEGGSSVSSTGKTGSTLENLSNKIVSTVTDPNQIYSLADALAEIPEVKKFKSQVLAGDARIDDLTKAKSRNYEDLKKQYPNVPQSVIMGMEAKMDKDLDDQIYNAQRDRNYASGMLTYYADIAKSKVEARNTIAAEQRKLVNDKALQQYEAGLKPNTVAIGNDLYQYDEVTGKWSLAVSGTGKVALQQIKRINPLTGMEETIGSFDPSTGVSSFYDGTTAGGSSGISTASTGSSSAGGTLADRNNNPGNLRDPFTGAFRKFATAEEGMAAMEQDVYAKLTGKSPATRSKLGRDAQTLQDVISVYAPKEDNNDPASYAAAVAKDLGVSVNEPVKNLIPRLSELTQAMAKHEGWTGGASTQSQTTVDPQTVIASITQGDAKKFASTNAQYQNVLARNGQKAASEWLIKQAINNDADTKKKFEAAQKEVGDTSSLLSMLDQANYNPGIIANKLLDLKSWTGIGITEGDKQAMVVRTALIANQAKKRNELFGASLSTNEGNSANQFLALSPNETIESIKAKLKSQQAMAQIAQENIKMRAIGVPEEVIQQHEKEAVTALMDSFKTTVGAANQDVSSFANGLTTEGSSAKKPSQRGNWATPSVKEKEQQVAAGNAEGMVKFGQDAVQSADSSYEGFKDRTPEEKTQAFKEMKVGTWYKIDDDHYVMKNKSGTVTKLVPSRLSGFGAILDEYTKFHAIQEMDAKSALK